MWLAVQSETGQKQGCCTSFIYYAMYFGQGNRLFMIILGESMTFVDFCRDELPAATAYHFLDSLYPF